ncbi:MAG: riboflavin kinase, partial [Patescibacteria group bacterium]
VKGDGYGKKLGFPTVNLNTAVKPLGLREGVYSGSAVLNGREYRAGIVIGPGEKVEAHLMGYNGDAYGKTVTLEIKNFLRAYKKFDTEEELKEQIKKDIEQC